MRKEEGLSLVLTWLVLVLLGAVYGSISSVVSISVAGITATVGLSCHCTWQKKKILSSHAYLIQTSLFLGAGPASEGEETLDSVLSNSVCLEAFSRKPGQKRFGFAFNNPL